MNGFVGFLTLMFIVFLANISYHNEIKVDSLEARISVLEKTK